MKKVFVMMIASLMAVSLLSAAVAEEKKEAAPQEQKRITSFYSGIVHKVSVKKKTLTVGKPNMDLGMLFDVSRSQFEGYKGLKEIKRGDKVSVEYDTKLARTIAIKVTKE